MVYTYTSVIFYFVLVDAVSNQSSFNQNGVYTINVINASKYGNDNDWERSKIVVCEISDQNNPINCGLNSNLLEWKNGASRIELNRSKVKLLFLH